MKLSVPAIIYIVSITVFLTNCKSPADTKSDNKSSDSVNVATFVNEWNKAHASKDVTAFTNLYSNNILYYGMQKDKNYCLESKLSLFKKYPDYYQQIFGNIQSEKISETEFKCSFVKRVTFNQKTNDYPSYLVFTKEQDAWKITTEGDLVTDKNLAKAKEVKIPKDAVKGDFNGDGVPEYAWLVPPKESECGTCEGNCTSYIKFSDNTIPSIKVESSIGGNPNNLGDLNKNGADEIGLLPDWCSSCWRGYNVYTLKNNNWIFAVDPISTHCDQWEKGVNPIEIDPNKDGNVLIRYSDMTEDDLVIKTKSVPIK
jgi:ketosteroid isomerase-like protein